MTIGKVAVYCASSRQVAPVYFDAARCLGKLLAEYGVTIVYGGGGEGLMGELADSALQENGKVVGVIPHFMYQIEWGHENLTEMKTVDDMHERKSLMIRGVDAVVALPGGCGTMEELLEVITLKRLGQFLKPIVIVSTNGYFDPLVHMLNRSISERFMDKRHESMWSVVRTPQEVVDAIQRAPKWYEDSLDFAAI